MSDVVLLGMGGSSLAPEVMRSRFSGRRSGYPRAARHRLDRSRADSRGRAQHRLSTGRCSSWRRSPAARSKSTSSSSISSIARVQKFGEADAGRRFVLTTDPGSKLQQTAEQEHFRRNLPGRSQRRRPLLRVVELRPGAGGVDRRRRVDAARSRRGDGAPLRSRMATATRRCSWACCSACWRSRAATSRR